MSDEQTLEEAGEIIQALPLDQWHQDRGARMVSFAGYSMPIQYEGIIAEHLWTRESAGLFDVSHMGQLLVSGDDVDIALEALMPGDFVRLGIDRMRYSLLLDDEGGILDDLMVTRRAGDFYLVVNGATKADDIAHLHEHLAEELTLNHLDEQALLALQGRIARLARKKRFLERGAVLAFEGMDAAGKGGAIRRLVQALDPRQYRIIPVSAPSPEERAYPYLWRFWKNIPSRGNLSVFDRSWYGRVLVERVRGFATDHDWQRAFAEINEFERQLAEHGLVVCKFWLDVSEKAQLARFLERDANPLKRFKVDPEDWINRDHFPAYRRAASDMVRLTDAPHARWTLVDADDKQRARIAVLEAVASTIEAAID